MKPSFIWKPDPNGQLYDETKLTSLRSSVTTHSCTDGRVPYPELHPSSQELAGRHNKTPVIKPK